MLPPIKRSLSRFELRTTVNYTPLQLLYDRPKHPRRHLCLEQLQFPGRCRKTGRFALCATKSSIAGHTTGARRHTGYRPRSAEGSNRACLLISSNRPKSNDFLRFCVVKQLQLRNVSHAILNCFHMMRAFRNKPLVT